MPRRPLIAALALLCASSALSAQTTWFVDAAASGPGSGSSGDPFPTIQQGVTAAQSGDTVQVAAGLYSGTVNVLVDDLEIVGAGAGLSVLDASGNDAGFSAAVASPAPRLQDLRIAGFTVRQASRWQVILWRCDRPVLEDLELVGLGRNVPSPSPGTTSVTGLNLAEVVDANVARVQVRDCFAGGVAITGGSSGNVLRDLVLSDNVGDLAGFASINLWTTPGASVGGGSNALSFAGACSISASPRGLLLEDTPAGAIDLSGGASLSFFGVVVPCLRYGLGVVQGLDLFLDDAGLDFRATGGEPFATSGEAFFADFVNARAAALQTSAPQTVLLYDRADDEYEVDPSLSLAHALSSAPSGSCVYAHPGRYLGPFVLERLVHLEGAQRGVDARTRATGVPNTSAESVLAAPGELTLQIRGGATGARIVGLAFEAGCALALETIAGPIHGLAIRECWFEPGLSGPVRFSAVSDDLDFERNLVRSASGTGPAIALSPSAFLRGLRLRENHVLRLGSASLFDNGLFADRRGQIEASATRTPELARNRFEGHATGLFAGQAGIHDALIADNAFLAQRIDGAAGGFQDCVFRGNLFDGNGESGLYLTGFGGSGDATRGAQRCVVSGNTFQGNAGEALFFSSLQFPGTISTSSAHGNSFVGNGAGAAYFGTETIDATLCWWGAPNGPSGVGGGSGDAAYGVVFDPWLSCPPEAGRLATGDAVALALGDLVGDPTLDLALADRDGDSVRVRENNGSGSFPSETQIALDAGDAPAALDIGDVLPGAARGIAVACAGSARVRLIDATLGLPVSDRSLPGIAPVALRALALDGGASDDLVVALAGDANGNAGLAVALGGGGFALLPAPASGAWPSAIGFAALDLDGDLDLDLAVLLRENLSQAVLAGEVALYANDGLGGFSYLASLALALQLGEEVRGIASGDLDRDGQSDLLVTVAQSSSGRLAILRGLGAGAFAPVLDEPLAYAPTALVVGDLREDSLPGFTVDTEVAILAPALGIVAVHAGFDGVDFRRFEACPAGLHASALALINVEPVDCLPDLLVADSGGDALFVHLTGASALARPYGVGCAGSVGVPAIGAVGRPLFGNTGFAVTLSNAAPAAPIALMAAGGTGAGGCAWFLLDLPFLFFPGSADANGSAALLLPIPSDPFVECAQLFAQWIVIDPAGTFLGGPFALSDALRIRVGD
ncbi:MAG: hypothetical protein IPN34_22570 [Planctomycetes bacterium]|nr:hypothetical protein [Planctomycetota bacterium]